MRDIYPANSSAQMPLRLDSCAERTPLEVDAYVTCQNSKLCLHKFPSTPSPQICLFGLMAILIAPVSALCNRSTMNMLLYRDGRLKLNSLVGAKGTQASS